MTLDTFLIVAFLMKHFVVDFLLQPRWMYANKGKLGHPGGIAHAVLHGVATATLLISFVSITVVLSFATLESVAHYAIDWAKVNINTRTGWGPTTSEYFWWLLGLDQLLHQFCYVAIIIAVKGF